MKGFDVLKVKSAVKTHNKFDLSHSHLTTMNFGEIVPLLAEETVPGDKFSIKGDYFSRMAPLVKPTYGKFQFKTVNAFVPYHMLAADAEAWFAGKTSWEGVTPHNRYFTVQELFTFVTASARPYTESGSSTSYDVTFIGSDGNVAYKRFTKIGKYVMKVLHALGYTLPEGVDISSGSSWVSNVGTIKLSAFPLLAFFKLYNDYMSQSQRFNSSALSNYLNAVKYNRTVTGFVPATGALSAAGLKTMFDNLRLNYENDYFTSAWMTPNNAISNAENINEVNVPSSLSYENKVQSTFDDNKLYTEIDQIGALDVSSIGQRALDFLRSFDDWVRRNNYSGSRAVQQIYSRFGIKTDDYRSHYANVISTETLPIQVGDVTATAGSNFTLGGESQTVALGDYSGKGIMSGSKGFSYSCSDYGILLVLGYFTVTPMMSFGYDRKVLRSQPLDYYNPEFDGIGADAISVGEVWASPIEVNSQVADNAVFGYTERYNAYRYGRDVISGEFRDYNPDGDMNTWHTGRNLASLRSAGALIAQSTGMNTLPQTDSEYNRIFSVTDGGVDHFYLTARFNIDAVRPMLNLNQVVNLGEGDTLVPRNGNVIS